MPGPGIEPGWGCPQGILSPSRLASFATPAGQRWKIEDGRWKAAVSAPKRKAGRHRPMPCLPAVHLRPSIFDRCSYRAGNGTRTRDPNLGKVVLYQLSYSRDRVKIGTRHDSYKLTRTASSDGRRVTNSNVRRVRGNLGKSDERRVRRSTSPRSSPVALRQVAPHASLVPVRPVALRRSSRRRSSRRPSL